MGRTFPCMNHIVDDIFQLWNWSQWIWMLSPHCWLTRGIWLKLHRCNKMHLHFTWVCQYLSSEKNKANKTNLLPYFSHVQYSRFSTDRIMLFWGTWEPDMLDKLFLGLKENYENDNHVYIVYTDRRVSILHGYEFCSNLQLLAHQH